MTSTLNYTYEWYEQVESTMDIAKLWAYEHNKEAIDVPHIIQAGSQNQGRGKQGRAWHSSRGNCFITMITHFPFSLESRGQLSFVTGISMVEALKILAPNVCVKLKWPNDFYVETMKIGGILLEYYDEGVPYMGIGVGINVVSSPSYIPATNLQDETKKLLDVHEIREHFMKRMLYNLDQWKAGGFHRIKDSWIANSMHTGKIVTLTQGKKKHKGLFSTIHHSGALVLKDETGNLNMFSTGDVFFAAS